ncbi:MAG: xanthine dehydrogenase family protein subunit M [Candidatus Bathyarchaeota archaeon]|nr:MAG: xanthine dehydrogenase family protein subunit M [Candidatus Bathyarchaeota archaeon]
MNINRENTHIIPIGFEYHAPESLDKAVELLHKLSEETKILAGGTDLIPQMKQRKTEPRNIVNIKKIPELSCIKETREGIKIGALTKLRAVELSSLIRERSPVLSEAAGRIGSVQIRNLGTIGGNICNASPSADMATALMALDAMVHVYRRDGARTCTVAEFFQGASEIDLQRDELLTGFTVPFPPEGAGSAFEKVGWTTFDIATVNVAAVVTLKGGKIDHCSIALGACSPAPVKVVLAEDVLKGKEPTAEVLEEAVEFIAACVEPRERWRRAPPEYRRRSSQALAMDAISRAVEQARGST